MNKEMQSTQDASLGFDRISSEKDRRAIRRFAELFSSLEAARIREMIGEVYSDDAYLNDTLSEHHGLEEIREYFLETARAVHRCEVELLDVVSASEGYYLRWAMAIEFKNLRRGQVCRSQGMSHLRISDGKVAFHQDYWDAAGHFFEYIPLLGRAIRWIKSRL